MMKPTSTLLCVLAFVWLFGFSVLGQEPQSAAKPESQSEEKKPEIITSMTLESFQRMIQGMGFDCTRGKDDKGVPDDYFMFKAEGYDVGAEVPVPSSYLYLFNVFAAQMPPEFINQWNGNNNFSRAYSKPGEKSVYLDTDIIIHGGVTRENIEAQVKEFRDSVARWARFVIDHQIKDTPVEKKTGGK
jgi:hypothetical protein